MNRALIIIFSFLFALLLLLLLVLFLPQVLSGNTARAPGDGEILVEFLDVGQADCALVRTKDVTVLIDTGAPETANRVIKHLKSAGI